MADNAAAKAVKAADDLMREVERVREALLTNVDASDCNAREADYINAVQYLLALTESAPDEVVSAERMAEIRKNQISLLGCLPGSSAFENKIIIQELLHVATRYPDVRTLFQYRGAINQILNPASVLRSYSDDALQCLMAELVYAVSTFKNNDSKILHVCPGAMSFLVACLTSKTAETRKFALRAVSLLSSVVSNREVIGESGAMKALIKVVQEKDSVGLRFAASAIFNLCTVVKNGERAVSEGVVIGVMENIRSGVVVNLMLEILEVLSGHEKAVLRMEENGVVECLFGILREEDVKEEERDSCVSIVHAMCGDDVAKTRKLMNEVENARNILERVASGGTAKAKEKASELLSKLDSADNLAGCLERMDIEMDIESK